MVVASNRSKLMRESIIMRWSMSISCASSLASSRVYMAVRFFVSFLLTSLDGVGYRKLLSDAELLHSMGG